MPKPQHDEIRSFLRRRRQTRFIRHYGGPIMAFTLFAACLWFVWKAFESRQALVHPQIEVTKPRAANPHLQAAKLPLK